MNTHTVIKTLMQSIVSRGHSLLFLNGAPGSGKSNLLQKIKTQIPAEVPNTVTLGPYTIDPTDQHELSERLLNDLSSAGYLDEKPATLPGNLVETWRWLSQNLHTRPGQCILVLLDLKMDFPGIEAVTLFSALRALEGSGMKWGFKLHHVIIGFWSDPDLQGYYTQVSASVPYVTGDNYYSWYGLTANELGRDLPHQKHRELRAQLLHEITGGHPGVVNAVLERIDKSNIRLDALVPAVREVARSSAISERLIDAWGRLPIACRGIQRNLLLKRRVRVLSSDKNAELLITAGIATYVQVETSLFLKLRSWFVEIALWSHASALGLEGLSTNLEELIPEVLTYNQQAYMLINEVENLARNFVVAQTSHHEKNGALNLRGRVKRLNDTTGNYEDLEARAQQYRKNSPVDMAAVGLIAFCTTSDLAQLIKDLGRDYDEPTWRTIADGVERLVKIRNVVMHNQLIDDDSLEQLYTLRRDIYQALGE